MPDASEEQIWWSTLFTGGADPVLGITEDVWDSLVEGAFDTGNAGPTDDLMPVNGIVASSDEWAGTTASDEAGQAAVEHAEHGDGLGDSIAPHDHMADLEMVGDFDSDRFDDDTTEPIIDDF